MNRQKAFQIFENFNFITNLDMNCILYIHISLLLFLINNLFQNIDQSHFFERALEQ
jgi:hypothetical protein